MAERSRRVIWSPEAERDLLDVWSYLLREGSVDVADNQLRNIERACVRLEEWPFSGQGREELLRELRSIPVHPHVVFFRVADAAVEIVRVLHGSHDIDAVFGADFE